jgi:excisionase family DNA binding protein
MDRYLTTGQVAQELKTSAQTIRNYCDSGVIKATKSAGGHYRIEPAELERLKSLESLPAVARATLSGNNTRSPAKRNPNGLLAEPSIDAIESAEDAYRTERELATDTHQLARKRIRREGVELDDWFEARDEARREKRLEQEQREQEAYQRQIRQRQAHAAADERRRFEKKWLSYAVERKPWNGPDDYAVVIRPEVMATLAELQPDEDHYTVERLVNDSINRALQPWRNEQHRRQAIEGGLDSLPWSMGTNNNWRDQARIAAAAAVASTRADASPQELRAIAQQAVHPLIQKYEHGERVEEATRYLRIPGGTNDEEQEAREIARAALSALPVDATRRQFEQETQNAIAPIRARIEARTQKQADDEERQALMARLAARLPWNFSSTEKTTTLGQAAEAAAALPAAASPAQREQAGQQAIERQAAKRRMIEEGLCEIPRHAQRLLHRYRYGARETAAEIEQRVRPEVEKELRTELRGTESPREVVDMVRNIMEDLEGCTE